MPTSQADPMMLLEVLNDSMSMVSDVSGLDDFEGGNESSQSAAFLTSLDRVFQGRDSEIQLLQQCVERVSLGPSELLFVSGPSGVGKSSLVESLRTRMEDSDAFYLVSGKFDQYLRREPFSAISAAFGELADLLQQHPQVHEIAAALRTELSPEEMQILCSFVSNLQTMRGSPGDPHEFTLRHYQAFDGFKMLCQKFIRIISSYATLCIFLDDVQWAEPESLQVLSSLAKDTKSTNVLLIAAYREVTKPLEEFLAQEFDLTQSHINLENLDAEAVIQTVAIILKTDAAKTQPLGELVYSRTMGNPYHAIQFMQTLQRNKLISMENKAWTWDLDRIQSETFVSDNVADLILSKITSLHAFVQGMLKLGSCLGYQFDDDLLKLVALGSLPPQNRAQMADIYGARIDQALAVGMKEGLLERCGKKNGIKFTHDRVQQTLYGMFSENEKPTLHLRVGRLLQESLEESDENYDSLLFLAVEQLNRGIALTDVAERVGIAQLNLKASRLAMSKSAFQASTDYILVSCGLLADSWESDYDLTLQAFTTAAQYHCCTGRFEESKAAADAVLQHAKTTMAKMPVYYTMIDALGSQDLLSDALDLGSKILNKELHVKTPRRAHPGQIVAELGRVTRLLRRKTDDQLIDMPAVSDETMAAAMRITVALSMIAFFAQENMNYPFLWLRAMKLTLRYGQDRLTSPIFACYGIVNAFMGRYTAAHRFGMLSRKLITKTGAWDDEPVTETLICSFTSHWKLPIADQLPYYDKAFRVGLATGNTNFAVLADISIIETNFAIGANLDDLEKECARCCNLLIALNKKTLMKACLPIWQCVLNLQGKSDDPIILTGDAMDEDEVIDEDCQTGFDLAMSNAHQLKMTLACLFQAWGDCADAARIMKSHPEIFLCISAHYFSLSFTLFSGVAYFNLAKASWRRRHIRAARRNLKRAQGWVNIDCPDALPVHAILVAEDLVFQNRSDKIEAAYGNAIAACRTAKQLHYEAFANERCGTVLAQTQGGEATANAYYFEAIRLYKKWGAMAKVDQIMQHMAPGMKPPADIEEGTFVSIEKGSHVATLDKETVNASSASGSNPATEQNSVDVSREPIQD